MYRSSNPALRKLKESEGLAEGQEAASYKGVAFKALYFVGLAVIAAIITAALLFRFPAIVVVMIIVSAIASLVCALIAAFVPRAVPVFGSLYMVFEGVLIGAISAIANAAYGGIVSVALMATLAVFGIMTVLFATGVIKVTHKFKSFMYSALLGIVVVSLLVLLLSLFVAPIREAFYGNGPIAIAISVLMVLFAAFFILVDLFDIQQIVENGMPKHYEWRAAYSLTITLIWLYLEILRLLLRILSRVKK